MILLADSEGPDQTVRILSLIWAFDDSICPKTRFRIARLKFSTIYGKGGNFCESLLCFPVYQSPSEKV